MQLFSQTSDEEIHTHIFKLRISAVDSATFYRSGARKKHLAAHIKVRNFDKISFQKTTLKKFKKKSFLTLAGYNFFVWKSFKLIFGDDSSQLWNVRFCVVIPYLTGRRDEFDRFSQVIFPSTGNLNRNLCSVSVRSAQLPLRNIESRSWSLCKEPRATTASWRAISRSVSSTTDPSLVWRNVVWKRQTGNVTFRPTRNVNGANTLVAGDTGTSRMMEVTGRSRMMTIALQRKIELF